MKHPCSLNFRNAQIKEQKINMAGHWHKMPFVFHEQNFYLVLYKYRHASEDEMAFQARSQLYDHKLYGLEHETGNMALLCFHE